MAAGMRKIPEPEDGGKNPGAGGQGVSETVQRFRAGLCGGEAGGGEATWRRPCVLNMNA
jgi:hypothetical protein